MKRVLVLTSAYPTEPARTFNAGGFVRDISRALRNLGHPVRVLTPAKGVPITDPELEVMTFPWVCPTAELATLSPSLPNLFRLSTLLGVGTLVVAAAVKVWRPEAVLAFWALPSGLLAYAATRVFRVPYGVWALGSDIWGRHRYPMGEAVVRRVLSRASFRLADGLGLAREVAALSAQPCEFLPSARTLPEDIRPASLSGPEVNLLFVGRFEYQKGIDLLIDAASSLRDRGVRARLHIVGDGSLRNLVFKRVEARNLKGYVTFYGYGTIDTIVAMMKACDYLVIPSRIESIPVVLSDAVQCELPVVVTDVGDMGAVVSKWGIGLVAGPPNAAAIAAGIEAAVGIPKSTFRPNLRAARRLFDPHAVAARLSQLIEGYGHGPERLPMGLLADQGDGPR